jgi:hypothetical protein
MLMLSSDLLRFLSASVNIEFVLRHIFYRRENRTEPSPLSVKLHRTIG